MYIDVIKNTYKEVVLHCFTKNFPPEVFFTISLVLILHIYMYKL